MTGSIIRLVKFPHLYPVRKTFIVFIDKKKKERWKSGRFHLIFSFRSTLSECSPNITLGLLIICFSLTIHASYARTCFLPPLPPLSNSAYFSESVEPGNHKAATTGRGRCRHKPPSHKYALLYHAISGEVAFRIMASSSSVNYQICAATPQPWKSSILFL